MKESYIQTLLYLYPKVKDEITKIQEVKEKKAKNSFYLPSSKTIDSYYQIIEYNEIQALLFMLKKEVDKVLITLKPKELKIIEYKYFKKGEVICNRNYYRLVNVLTQYISNKILITNEYFEDNFLTHDYFSKIHFKIIEKITNNKYKYKGGSKMK